MKKIIVFIWLSSVIVAGLLFFTPPVYAVGGAFVVESHELARPIGFLQRYRIKSDKETLVELAIKYDLGYNEIVDANPGIDPWYPGKGTMVLIPTSWLLPYERVRLERDRGIIVVNLAEMRLYLFKVLKDGRISVLTFPIGIGRQGADTPLGYYRVIEKLKDPVWYVPESIRKEDPTLPIKVPPGPDNPLGKYALRLSNPSYLIHGTNKPLGIGRRVSHGCLRMYPEDIRLLYRLVRPGDGVLIVYEPVKINSTEKGIYVEIHRDYRSTGNNLNRAVNRLIQMGILNKVPIEKLYRIVSSADGVPHFIPYNR